MKNLTLSFDQCRHKLRRELFIQRQSDRDNSEARLFYDARKLDANLVMEGYTLPYQTEWGVRFYEKRHLERENQRLLSNLETSQTDLLSGCGT